MGGGPDGKKEGDEEGCKEGREAHDEEEDLAQEVARTSPGGLPTSARPPESRSWKSCSAPTHQRRRSEAAAPRAARADRRFAAEALVAFAAPLRAAVSPARADRARADRRRFPLRSGDPGASHGAGQRAAVPGD